MSVYPQIMGIDPSLTATGIALPAAHAGPCQHRWRIHPVPEPEAAA